MRDDTPSVPLADAPVPGSRGGEEASGNADVGTGDGPSTLLDASGSPEGTLVPLVSEPCALALLDRPPADRHPLAVYLARLAPRSRRTQGQALERISGFLSGGRLLAPDLDWTRVGYPHAAAVRSWLAEAFAPATANRMLCALRGVLGEAWRLGYLTAEAYQRARDVPPVRGNTLPRGRALSAGELRALFEACRDDPRANGARDAALLGVLYGTGLRRSELVTLDLADYTPDTWDLRVHRGKGRKARLCHAPTGCARALDRWIARRGSEPGPLFLPITRGGRIQKRRLTDQAVLDILVRRAHLACVPHFSPHDMRRTFISDLLEAGADISTVGQMAGHASVSTTARYDRRGEQTRRKAAELLHVPYTE